MDSKDSNQTGLLASLNRDYSRPHRIFYHLCHSLVVIFIMRMVTRFQFAQFALLTETVAVFATYVLGYIGSHKMKVFLTGQIVS